MSRVDGILEWAEILRGIVDTERQFCLKQSVLKKDPPLGRSNKKVEFSGIQPPRENKQSDGERSASCYSVPHISFKHKTSFFDTAFSGRAAFKLGILNPV
jgi:hypothetical protein